MVSMIVGLVALLAIGGLIIAGTRFSLYLFYLQNAEGTHSFAHPTPADERPSFSTAYNVERPTYAPVLSSESSSSRYALGSLMVIAIILVLAIIAVISVIAGMPH